MNAQSSVQSLIISSLLLLMCSCATSELRTNNIDTNSSDQEAGIVNDSTAPIEVPITPEYSEGEYKPHDQEDPLGGIAEITDESEPLESPDLEDGGEGEYKPHESEAALTGIAGESPEKDIMLTFDVPELSEIPESTVDPQAIYQATVDGAIFPCQRWSAAPIRIYCIGPLARNNVIALIRLENLTTGALLYEGEISILIPEEEVIGDQPQSCSGLDQSTCMSRSDCEWKFSKFPASCEAR